jgi:protoporphyrinogen oxidase
MGGNASIVIIGAGPAGLAAAYESIRLGILPVLLEKSNIVGGISRTEQYNGYYFDVGGHRFFSKSAQINRLWQHMLGEDFLKVTRKSRIYYKDRYFNYPLRPVNALYNLGIFESFQIVFSYLKSQLWPYAEEETFEQWISNRFGRRLYEIFFKAYTEKLWGIPCKQIQADWAAQRIKSLSLVKALLNSLFGIKKPKTLINEFNYPSKGPGMMWQRFQEKVEAEGGTVLLNSEVRELRHEKGRITSVSYIKEEKYLQIPVEHLISSAPITALVYMLNPKAPEEVLQAARNLSYRAFFIVVFIIDKPFLFSDQWIYINNPNVRVGRIQNFKNWSARMVPELNKTSIGMEYFCNEGDDLWIIPDSDLAQMASHELSELGLVDAEDILDHCVIRQPKAYPVYDKNYRMHLCVLRNYLKDFINLQTVGRNGMHRYNNMDHSMLTGMMATRNIVFGSYDLWAVNEKERYLEE